MQDVRVRALASTVVDISAVKRLAPSESDGAPKRKNGKKGKKEEKRGRIYFSTKKGTDLFFRRRKKRKKGTDLFFSKKGDGSIFQKGTEINPSPFYPTLKND